MNTTDTSALPLRFWRKHVAKTDIWAISGTEVRWGVIVITKHNVRDSEHSLL
jgi:hypothetical protein